jgi:hypothetical protein
MAIRVFATRKASDLFLSHFLPDLARHFSNPQQEKTLP